MLPFPSCHWGGGDGAVHMVTGGGKIFHDSNANLQPDGDFDYVTPANGIRLSRSMTMACRFRMAPGGAGLLNLIDENIATSARIMLMFQLSGVPGEALALLMLWHMQSSDATGAPMFLSNGSPFANEVRIQSVNTVFGFDIWHDVVVSVRLDNKVFAVPDIRLWLNGVQSPIIGSNGAPVPPRRGYLSFPDINYHIVGSPKGCFYDSWFHPTAFITDNSLFAPAGGLGSGGEKPLGGGPANRPAYFHTGGFAQFGVNRGIAGAVRDPAPRNSPCDDPNYPANAGRVSQVP